MDTEPLIEQQFFASIIYVVQHFTLITTNVMITELEQSSSLIAAGYLII
jgi:hypothetical protein